MLETFLTTNASGIVQFNVTQVVIVAMSSASLHTHAASVHCEVANPVMKHFSYRKERVSEGPGSLDEDEGALSYSTRWQRFGQRSELGSRIAAGLCKDRRQSEGQQGENPKEKHRHDVAWSG